jgi:hypothetical protein
MSHRELDLAGAVVAYVIYLSSIAVFLLRILSRSDTGAGIPILLMALPLSYLLMVAPDSQRPAIYFLQLGLMLMWIVVLFLVDYWPGFEFRDNNGLVIGFVVLYFAGIGGMIGVASLAGRGWMIGAVILFFITAVLAFVSRWVTGI